MRECAFSEQAEADLTSIALYVAEDSPRRALTFTAELRETCLKLAAFPEAFPLREEFGAGIRLAAYRRYLIFYSIHEEAVIIEHVRHGARDLEGLDVPL